MPGPGYGQIRETRELFLGDEINVHILIVLVVTLLHICQNSSNCTLRKNDYLVCKLYLNKYIKICSNYSLNIYSIVSSLSKAMQLYLPCPALPIFFSSSFLSFPPSRFASTQICELWTRFLLFLNLNLLKASPENQSLPVIINVLLGNFPGSQVSGRYDGM